jgi:protein SCO1/2
LRRRSLVSAIIIVVSAATLSILFFQPLSKPSRDNLLVASEKTLPPFQLVDQYNETFRLESLSGKPVILFFGYTNCPDVCPLAMRKISQALDAGGIGPREIAVIFVTVDPWRDTPPVLRKWVERNYPGVIALTGSYEDLAQVWRAYGVADPEDVWRARNNRGEYYISHSAVVYVADKRHVLRYLVSPEMSVEAFLQAIKGVIEAE